MCGTEITLHSLMPFCVLINGIGFIEALRNEGRLASCWFGLGLVCSVISL
jgi:hypothetical protein